MTISETPHSYLWYAWASLADVIKRLSDAATSTDRRPALQAQVSELVRLLEPLETYWAYPGHGLLQQIASLCDAGDHESAMRLANTVTRALSGHTVYDATTPEHLDAHDEALHRYQGAVVFGAGTRAEVDDIIDSPDVARAVKDQHLTCTAVHAYTVDRTVPVIRMNSSS